MSNSNRYFIKYENLPPKFPLGATAFWWMFLDYTNSPEWLFGVFGVGLALVWVGFFITIFTKEGKDIF